MEALGPHRCSVLSQDDYYRDLSAFPPELRGQVDYDRPEQFESDLLARHITELKARRGIEAPCYDFVTHTRLPQTRRVEPAAVLLVEGLLLFVSPVLRQHLDLRIFLAAPAAVRLQRRLERDVTFRGRCPETVRRQWHQSVLPAHRRYVEPSRRHAHLVIQTGGEWEPAIRLLSAALNFWSAPAVDNNHHAS
jgi:uridine kinase